MSQTTDIPQTDKPTLEQELAQLQVAEANLERKTKDMWSAEVVALVVAFIALILGTAGFVAGLSKATGGTTTVMMRSAGAGGTANAATGAAAAKTGMPAAAGGMMRNRTVAATTGPRTVNVALGEMYVRPSRSTITAGKVTFVARNMGMLTHELMIERMPMKMSGPGKPIESAAQGMIADMGHGGTGKMTIKLAPGTYMLFCNVPGHYASGQHTLFTVTRA